MILYLKLSWFNEIEEFWGISFWVNDFIAGNNSAWAVQENES